MQAIIDAVNASLFTLRTKGKSTIKGELEKLTEAGATAYCEEQEVTLDTSTKTAFIASLDALVTYIHDWQLVPVLDTLKAEIQEAITQAGATSIKLGKLLVQAREACENQKEFLDWTKENFGIGKAWAFKLMKVATVFTDEAWHGVAPSVLYTLQEQGTEEQMLEAKKFAQIGKLNLQSLKALLEPPVPVVSHKPADSSASVQRAAESVQEALMESSPVSISVPLTEPAQKQPAADIVAEIIKTPAKLDTLDLQQQLAEALTTIAQLTQDLATLRQPRINSGPQMPMLPQFSSSCLYARLGLSQEDAADKGKILEAFKALCKAGYGRQHEAFKLIDEARHELIHAGEEVAA